MMASSHLTDIIKFVKDNNWNFLHVQAITYKQNVEWTIIHVRIVLINSDSQIQEMDLRGEKIAFFQHKLEFSKFMDIYEDITNRKLTINGLETNFNFFSDQPLIEFHPRSTINELFDFSSKAPGEGFEPLGFA